MRYNSGHIACTLVAISAAFHLVEGIQLRVITPCTRLGHQVIYECTVNGSGATTWGGTAFQDCQQGNIILRHSEYSSGLMINRNCGDNGVISAHTGSAEKGTYTSLLRLNVSNYTVGDTIECSGGSEEGVESAQIMVDYVSPPVSVNFSTIDSGYITFSWDPVDHACNVSHYLVNASGCGECPNTTFSANLTCYIGSTELQNVCTVSVTTILDGNINGNQSTITEFIIRGYSYPGVIFFIVDKINIEAQTLVVQFDITDFDNTLDIHDNENNSSIVALNATIYTCESRWSSHSTTIDMDLLCNTSCTHTIEIPSYLFMDVTKDLFGLKLSHKNTTLLHHVCNEFDITSTTVYASTGERGQPTENNTVTIVIGSALLFVVISLVFGVILASRVAFIKVQKNRRMKQDNFVRVKQVNNSTNRHNSFDSVQVHIESPSEPSIDTLGEVSSLPTTNTLSSLPTANTQKVRHDNDNNQMIVNNTRTNESKEMIYAEIGPSSKTNIIVTYLDDDRVAYSEIRLTQEEDGQ